MEAMEKIAQLSDELHAGIKALEETKKQIKEDNDGLLKEKLGRIADDTAGKFEELQKRQEKLEAAMQRPGAGEDGKSETEEQKAEKASFVKLLRRGERGLSEAELKAMSTDSGPDGGYMVPVQHLGMINGRIFESSPMRRLATVVNTSAKSVEIVLDDQEASGGWIGEGDANGGAETNTAQVGKIEIAAKKMYANPKITTEMAADSAYDVEAWLGGKTADYLGRLENTAFVNGNGVSAPRGFLTYTAGTSTYARDTIEQVVNGSTSAPTENGLIALQASLKEDYQARAAWVMKRSTLGELMKLSGTNTFRFLNLQPQSGPQGSVFGSGLTLLDKPVVLMNDMPAIASASLSIGYGDFSRGYTIVDRVGISVLVDPYSAKGFLSYYTTKRTGGSVTNFEAIKLLKFSVN